MSDRHRIDWLRAVVWSVILVIALAMGWLILEAANRVWTAV